MLRRVHHSSEIDLIGWAEDDQPFLAMLETAIWGIATRWLREVFTEFEKDGAFNTPSFPHLFASSGKDGCGGKLPDDPLTIYIELPLGKHSDEHPKWSLTVTECIDDLLESGGRSEDGKADPGWLTIRDALRAQAQRIDDAIGIETLAVNDSAASQPSP